MAMRYHKVVGFNDHQVDMIRDKTLYLIGEDDPFTKIDGKEELLKYNMNIRFFPNVGHGINHEIADEINQIIIEYMCDNSKSKEVGEYQWPLW